MPVRFLVRHLMRFLSRFWVRRTIWFSSLSHYTYFLRRSHARTACKRGSFHAKVRSAIVTAHRTALPPGSFGCAAHYSAVHCHVPRAHMTPLPLVCYPRVLAPGSPRCGSFAVGSATVSRCCTRTLPTPHRGRSGLPRALPAPLGFNSFAVATVSVTDHYGLPFRLTHFCWFAPTGCPFTTYTTAAPRRVAGTTTRFTRTATATARLLPRLPARVHAPVLACCGSFRMDQFTHTGCCRY